jgi:hypothetical protein
MCELAFQFAESQGGVFYWKRIGFDNGEIRGIIVLGVRGLMVRIPSPHPKVWTSLLRTPIARVAQQGERPARGLGDVGSNPTMWLWPALSPRLPRFSGLRGVFHAEWLVMSTESGPGRLVQRDDTWLATRKSGFDSPAGPLRGGEHLGLVPSSGSWGVRHRPQPFLAYVPGDVLRRHKPLRGICPAPCPRSSMAEHRFCKSDVEGSSPSVGLGWEFPAGCGSSTDRAPVF